MGHRNFTIAAFVGFLAVTSIALASGESDNAPGLAPASQPGTDAAPAPISRDIAKPVAASPSAPTDWGGCMNEAALVADGSISPAIEPAALFEQLVKRYKGLHFYRDTARIVHITHRAGEETSRLETEIDCEVRDGGLKVETPTSQARSSIGLDLPVRKSAATEAMQRGYDLWLAPHMALKFADEPLKTFRSGVEEGFTPTEAEHVTIDNREMLHMELRSGDGLSESCTAKFNLFINPETMLVERIDGEQNLPDGGRCTTSMQITPRDFESEPALR